MATVDAVAVDKLIGEIKAYMPNVYASIQAKAKSIGSEAFGLVRRGLRGEPDCFYAFERGRVVGTPFAVADIMADVALHMVQFGVAHVAIWPAPAAGATNGAR